MKNNDLNLKNEEDELLVKEESTHEENNFFHLFFLQYLSSYSKGRLHSSVFDAISIWKKSKKFSLSDLLKYGDARKMLNWRKYLINIQQNSSSPDISKNNFLNPKEKVFPVDRRVGFIDIYEVKEKRSEILNSIAVSRRQLGNYFLSPPSSLALCHKLDSMHVVSTYAMKSVSCLFQNSAAKLPKCTGSGSIGTCLLPYV